MLTALIIIPSLAMVSLAFFGQCIRSKASFTVDTATGVQLGIDLSPFVRLSSLWLALAPHPSIYLFTPPDVDLGMRNGAQTADTHAFL